MQYFFYYSKFGSALHIACCHGYTTVVMSLLQGGADQNQVGSANQTPVFIAAANGKQEIIQILLQSGSDVNLCNDEGNNFVFSLKCTYILHETEAHFQIKRVDPFD